MDKVDRLGQPKVRLRAIDKDCFAPSSDEVASLIDNPSVDPLSPDFDPALLEQERLARREDVKDAAQRMFTENLLTVGSQILHLAVHGRNERIRLQAATYVYERVMGRIQDNPPEPPSDPFRDLMAKVVREINPAEARDEINKHLEDS